MSVTTTIMVHGRDQTQHADRRHGCHSRPWWPLAGGSRSWDQAVLRSTEGIPNLAPEYQLLFKSKNVRPKDKLDAEEVISELDPDRQMRLRQGLPENHPWRLPLPR
jgi:hypothetical protein